MYIISCILFIVFPQALFLVPDESPIYEEVKLWRYVGVRMQHFLTLFSKPLSLCQPEIPGSSNLPGLPNH